VEVLEAGRARFLVESLYRGRAETLLAGASDADRRAYIEASRALQQCEIEARSIGPDDSAAYNRACEAVRATQQDLDEATGRLTRNSGNALSSPLGFDEIAGIARRLAQPLVTSSLRPSGASASSSAPRTRRTTLSRQSGSTGSGSSACGASSAGTVSQSISEHPLMPGTWTAPRP